MSAKPTTAVTTAELRTWYRADEKRLARLSDAARKTVEPGARGRVHPEVGADFAKRTRGKVYTEGLSGKRQREAKAAAAAKREQLRAAGVAVGARGPLPKVAKAKVAKSKA